MKYLLLIILYAGMFLPFKLEAQQQVEKVAIKGKEYIGYLNPSRFFVLKANQDTTLNISNNDFVSFEFKDFNTDGYKDIFLEWGGNMSSRYSLYIYDAKSDKFKEIQNFSDFPAATLIKGTKYYYSYYRAGCADMAWGSHLFYIKDSKATKVGNIKGDGCGIKDEISIYKFKGAKKELVNTLPINIIQKYKDHKFGFIKQYWAKNLSKFE